MKLTLFSKYKLNVSAANKKEALNLLLNSQIALNSSKINKENSLEISVSKKQFSKIKRIFDSSNIDYETTKIFGILKPLERIRHRLGFALGCLMLMLVLLFSSNIVWKIDIEGNRYVSDDEIIDELNNAGFKLGTYIPNVDYDQLHNKILLNSEKLSWVSVNIVGNHANIKVKEKESKSEEKKVLYTNVVAASDGYITSVIVIDGKKTVSIGDVVKKGELLISGIIDSQSQGVRYEHAKGEVKAFVNKEILVKIPLKNTKKIYTNNIYKEKSFKIYNFPLKFLIKYRNSRGFYDTIEKKEQLHILGISKIPIEVTTSTKYEYTLEDINYTIEEAVDLAFAELRMQMDRHLENSELVSKAIETDYNSECFYLRCKLYCLEDIAVEKEFFVEE